MTQSPASLTAKRPGSAPSRTLDLKYWTTFSFTHAGAQLSLQISSVLCMFPGRVDSDVGRLQICLNGVQADRPWPSTSVFFSPSVEVHCSPPGTGNGHKSWVSLPDDQKAQTSWEAGGYWVIDVLYWPHLFLFQKPAFFDRYLMCCRRIIR